MPVHNIDMDDTSPALARGAHLLAKTGKVSRKNRRCQLDQLGLLEPELSRKETAFENSNTLEVPTHCPTSLLTIDRFHCLTVVSGWVLGVLFSISSSSRWMRAFDSSIYFRMMGIIAAMLSPVIAGISSRTFWPVGEE